MSEPSPSFICHVSLCFNSFSHIYIFFPFFLFAQFFLTVFSPSFFLTVFSPYLHSLSFLCPFFLLPKGEAPSFFNFLSPPLFNFFPPPFCLFSFFLFFPSLSSLSFFPFLSPFLSPPPLGHFLQNGSGIFLCIFIVINYNNNSHYIHPCQHNKPKQSTVRYSVNIVILFYKCKHSKCVFILQNLQHLQP